MDTSWSPPSHWSPKGSVVSSTSTVLLSANKEPSRKKNPLPQLVWAQDARAVSLDCVSLPCRQGTQRGVSTQRLRGGNLLGNASAPIVGARALLETSCTQSPPAQLQLAPAHYGAPYIPSGAFTFTRITDEQKAPTPTDRSSSMADTNGFSTLPAPGAPHPSFTGNKQVAKSWQTEGGSEFKKNGM